MATSDGESCSAEDRALDEWRAKGEAAWCSLNCEAFRAGFRAGQEHPKRPGAVAEMRVVAPADSPLGVELSKIRDRLNALEKEAGQRHKMAEAQTQSFDQRMVALEKQVAEINRLDEEGRPETDALVERIEALEANMRDLRGAGVLGRLEQLETWRRRFVEADHIVNLSNRIASLENHPERLGSSEKHIDRRVEAVEHSLTSLWKAYESQVQAFDQRLSAIEAKLRLLEPIG